MAHLREILQRWAMEIAYICFGKEGTWQLVKLIQDSLVMLVSYFILLGTTYLLKVTEPEISPRRFIFEMIHNITVYTGLFFLFVRWVKYLWKRKD